MKLSINKSDLNEAIQHVSRAISSRTAIPILSGIKFDAGENGVVLTASDTDISIQSYIPAVKNDQTIVELHQAGNVVLPAKFFVEIIRKLPSEHVEIEVMQQFHTWIRSGSTEIQLVGMDPEEYPVLPTLDEDRKLSVSGSLLKSMIRKTAFSVSANESTPILTGVMWQFEQGQFQFIATDRHRLASCESTIEGEFDLSFSNIVISGKTLLELGKLIPDQQSIIDIVVTDNQVLFKVGQILFFTRLLEGTYPDTSRIIPQSFKTELVLSTSDFESAIDRAYLLSREEKTNIVHMATKDNGAVEITSSSSELGKVREQLNIVSFSGEPLKIAFNSKYMLDVLKVIDSENIQIGFTGPMSPIIIRPQDEHKALFLILPYRTTN